MDLPLHPEWLKPFKGSSHSFLDCEVLALEKIDPELRHVDWLATETCWFDYVRLHPVKAFYYFCDCYSRAYGDYLAANIDYDLRFHRGIKGDPLDSRELKSLLSLKRGADKLTMPYEMWLNVLFKQIAAQGWTRPPRPAHLANNLEAIEVATLYWADNLDHMTTYAVDPWFTVEAWTGHPQQQRYENWMVDSLKHRMNRELSLAVAIYDKRAIRLERAVLEFGEGVVAEAQDWQAHCNQISNE